MKRLFAVLVLATVAVAAAGCGGGGNQGSTGSAATATTSTASTQSKAQAATSGGHTGAKAASNSAPLPPPPTSFTTHKLTPAQGSQLTGKGETTILVRVGGPGEVSAFGQAQLDKGIERVATTPSKTVSAPGLVRLPVRLTPPARAWLAAGKDMTVYFGVYFSKTVTGQRLVAHLKG